MGRTAAQILTKTEDHVNKAYALTNHEQLTFNQMTATVSEVLSEHQ
ncbi:hypothetical protein [Portibacter marinus]|nr:hypothetical protein [Portibacter marinus]